MVVFCFVFFLVKCIKLIQVAHMSFVLTWVSAEDHCKITTAAKDWWEGKQELPI